MSGIDLSDGLSIASNIVGRSSFGNTSQPPSNKKLLSELIKLASLQPNSRNLYLTAENIVFLAFRGEKPLFTEGAQKTKAARLTEISLTLLEESFAVLHGSLNPDRRQHAQRCRSGLQFLIDEFKNDSETYEKLKTILESSPVKCVEDYIKGTEDILAEFLTPIPEDLTKIPASHHWWF